MKSLTIFVLSLFCAAGAAAQSPQPSETTKSEESLAGGTVINAVLNSSVDSKKAKAGDQITAHVSETMKASDGRTVLPNGTKIVGHVTQASARSKGEGEAVLAIQFDKAMLKNGQEMALSNVMIQALAAPAQEASTFNAPAAGTAAPGTPTNNPSMSGSRGARTDSAATTQSYPDPSATPGMAQGAAATSAGPLPANARGVYGVEGVRLSTTSAGEGTVLTSTGKNVHLDGGTRLLLAVQPQGGTAAPSR